MPPGEFAELVGLCDRICVLWDGRIVAEIPGAEAREETLLLLFNRRSGSVSKALAVNGDGIGPSAIF